MAIEVTFSVSTGDKKMNTSCIGARVCGAFIALVASFTNTPALADGPFDPTFGDSGLAVYLPEEPNYGTPASVIEDSQGRLLVASTIGYQLALSRHTMDGNADKTFGADGVATDFINLGPSDNAWATSVIMDHHGRVLVGGGLRYMAPCADGGTALSVDYLLVRVINGPDLDGTSDLTFGNLGLVMYGDCLLGTEGVSGLAIGSDDSVFAVGTSYDSHGLGQTTVAKWTSEGKVDTSFGHAGATAYDPSTFGETDGIAIAIDSSGRLLVTTQSYNAAIQSGAVIRFTSFGALDSTFGVGGVVSLGQLTPDVRLHEGSLCCVRVDSRGRIVVAGLIATARSDSSGLADTSAFVARFNDDGKPDESFGQHGFATIGDGAFDSITALVLDGHDRPSITGAFKLPYAAVSAPTVIQLNSDGTINNAVGFNGIFSGEFGFDSVPTSLLVDAKGNVVFSAVDEHVRMSVLGRYDQIFGESFD